jgi:type I restriction enzyme S subunit
MPTELQTTVLRKCLEKVIDYRGKTPKKLGSDWTSEGYRALSANNVKDSGLTSAETIRCVDADTYKKWMKEEIRRGDILLTSEAPAGEVMIWDSDEKIVLSQRLFGLRTNDHFDNRFIKYYLQGPTGKREVNRTRSGSTVAGISAEMFDQIQVLHPELRSQKNIAGFLSEIDAKIELNNRINAELEALAKTIYDYWFVQFNFPDTNDRPYKASGGTMVWNDALKREVPAGWNAVALGDLVDEVRDTVSPDALSATTPYIGLEHIARKSIVLAAWSTADHAISNKIAFRSGDILFGKIRPYFHKVGLATVDGIASGDAIVMRPKSAALSGLALETVFSDNFVKATTVAKTGSKMPRADWKIMKGYRLAFPGGASSILADYQELFDVVAGKIGSHIRQNQELIQLRDWLLPLLMNGQVQMA